MRPNVRQAANSRSHDLEHALAWLSGRAAHHANALADHVVDTTERWAAERLRGHRARRACRASGVALAHVLVQLGDAVIRIGELAIGDHRR